MIDYTLRRQVLVFLAIMACLSVSLQTAGHLSFPETSKGALRCLEAFLVEAQALPTDTAGEGTCCDEYSSVGFLSLVPGLAGTALLPQRRIPPTARTSLAEGFHSEIYRPPIATV